VRQDGGVIETALEAYASGEDGKAGIASRLVNKQGQVLGRALLAGTLQAFSQTFSRQPVATISTGRPSNEVQYQTQWSPAALQSAGLAGVGSALDRLAQFYIDLAENLFPVIEINAGRAMDFVLVRGRELGWR
jgi:conjugal transfer pilus assembly protein TraB